MIILYSHGFRDRNHDIKKEEGKSKTFYSFRNSFINTMEDHKNIKDDKNEKESPELKEELTDDELKGVTGGVQWTQQDYKEEEKLGLWYPGM